ncbi:hypothetical protein BJY01DRAFT_245087 [Aspergillus pseudoustus]|uniref:Protein kinase domain-containing protein n=1 Tax=Aspergillus pseudoustus TaxID=1810923 RepID=A0ABR4KFU1_9EURO
MHICEVTAYKRLRESGLSDRAMIPEFYASIEDFNQKLHKPHLDMFFNVEYPPKAILLEYIPNMKQIHWKSYTDAKKDNLMKALEEIQSAGVIHGDIHPRNRMVFKRDPDRAIWIDFDRAQTWDKANITEQQKVWLEFESAVAEDQLSFMKADSEEGRTNKSARVYW